MKKYELLMIPLSPAHASQGGRVVLCVAKWFFIKVMVHPRSLFPGCYFTFYEVLRDRSPESAYKTYNIKWTVAPKHLE
jgi:hypothetical protein